jgi:hypothetical protein
LVGDTHGLQLTTKDMYEIHVFIYGHTWS